MCDNYTPIPSKLPTKPPAMLSDTTDITNSDTSDVVLQSELSIVGIGEPVINQLLVKKKKRCNLIDCNKKLFLGGRFECRCGYIFCGQHLYSDEHGCTINYLEKQREKLTRDMPKTEFSKIDKI